MSLLTMLPSKSNVNFIQTLKMLPKIVNKKSDLGLFPSTGLERNNQPMQSIILSNIDVTHGCNQQEVEVVNQQ